MCYLISYKYVDADGYEKRGYDRCDDARVAYNELSILEAMGYDGLEIYQVAEISVGELLKASIRGDGE